MRIWKWDLQVTDLQTVNVPIGAKLLTVQTQNSLPRLWALCNEQAPRRALRIAMYGTGNPVDSYPGTYIATFQVGDLVFHVFEVIGP